MDFITDILALGKLLPSARIATCGAKAMYTNIDTSHALTTIRTFLVSSQTAWQQLRVSIDVFMQGLHAVMAHYVFCFGDTYWLQMAGTAMGGSQAPMYATLYFGILEQQILPSFPLCRFYRRYIDERFLVWIPDPNWSLDVGLLKWQSFQAAFASVSPLEWRFSPLQLMVAFLDVMVKITDDSQITTQVYKKTLYL